MTICDRLLQYNKKDQIKYHVRNILRKINIVFYVNLSNEITSLFTPFPPITILYRGHNKNQGRFPSPHVHRK